LSNRLQRHFKEDAKDAMLEMVSDIRKEFRHIIDEVIVDFAVLS
jgi:predicted metalloendopeptidase